MAGIDLKSTELVQQLADELATGATTEEPPKGASQYYDWLITPAQNGSPAVMTTLSKDSLDLKLDLNVMSGLHFYPEHILYLATMLGHRQMDEGAAVTLAAVLEFTAAVILELSGNVARDRNAAHRGIVSSSQVSKFRPTHGYWKPRTVITQSDVQMAMENDAELKTLFSRLPVEYECKPRSTPSDSKPDDEADSEPEYDSDAGPSEWFTTVVQQDWMEEEELQDPIFRVEQELKRLEGCGDNYEIYRKEIYWRNGLWHLDDNVNAQSLPCWDIEISSHLEIHTCPACVEVYDTDERYHIPDWLVHDGCPKCAEARSAAQFELSLAPTPALEPQGPLLATSGDIQQCVSALYPGELATHAASEATKAVTKSCR